MTRQKRPHTYIENEDQNPQGLGTLRKEPAKKIRGYFEEKKYIPAEITQSLLISNNMLEVKEIIRKHPHYDLKKHCSEHPQLKEKWQKILNSTPESFNSFMANLAITSEVCFQSCHAISDFDLLDAHFSYLEAYSLFQQYYSGDIDLFYNDQGTKKYLEVYSAMIKARENKSIHAMMIFLQIYIRDILAKDTLSDADFEDNMALKMANEIIKVYGAPGYICLADVLYELANKNVDEESFENYNFRMNILGQAYQALLMAQYLQEFSSAAIHNASYGGGIQCINYQGFQSIEDALKYFRDNLPADTISSAERNYHDQLKQAAGFVAQLVTSLSKIRMNSILIS